MSNIETLKAMQCLIGSNCLVSTPETFYAGPKGYVSNTSLLNTIDELADSIDSIIKELATKISEEDLKTINGISLIGEGNIEIDGQGASIDLSGYLTKSDASKTYPKKEEVVYNTENILDLSKLDIKKHDGESFNDYKSPLQGASDLWTTVATLNAIYDFVTLKKYNALIYDGHLYYSVVGVYDKESSKQAYDNPITVLLWKNNLLYLLKTGETSLLDDAYPVAIRLTVFEDSTAILAAKIYTDLKISKLDPQHVLITKNKKDFSKEANIGRLLYLTEEIPLSFRFENSFGYSLYTKVYDNSEGYIVYDVPAYTDKFLSELVNSKYGEITFDDIYPTKLYPSNDNPELEYKETVILSTGLYYLLSVNNPILLSSLSISEKVDGYPSYRELQETTVLAKKIVYLYDNINLKDISSDYDVYILQYNGYYQGAYYSNIAFIHKNGNNVIVEGAVRVDDYGNVIFDPKSYLSGRYQNIYSNVWVKLSNNDIVQLRDQLIELININTNNISKLDSAKLSYHIIDSVDDYDSTDISIGDIVETKGDLNITHAYYMFKHPSGLTFYSESFDLNDHGKQVTLFNTRSLTSAVNSARYDVSRGGVVEDSGTVIKLVKQVPENLNEVIARKVCILTSEGYKKIADL